VPAAAQPDIRQVQLQFPKGQSGSTVKGTITGHETVDYKLRASAGQTLHIKMAGSKMPPYFNVLPPGSTGEALFIGSRDGDEAMLTLPASGDYAIRLYQMGAAKSNGRRTPFTMVVSINGAAAASSSGAAAQAEDPMVAAAARATEGKFNATGKIPCAQHTGQPMGQCDFGVARVGAGTAVVIVTLFDGRKRMLMFSKGKAVGADLSQADGDMSFRATKEADLFMIRAGKERYELPEAVIFGG
jgi:hypothetical protein